MQITIKKDVPREVLEDVFVTALEGGSNYWYFLTKKAVLLVRSAVPKSEDPCLSTALFKAVYDKGVVVPINDAEDEHDVIGNLDRDSFERRLQSLADSGDSWALDNELNGEPDANSSDVVFQYLALGEVVYG